MEKYHCTNSLCDAFGQLVYRMETHHHLCYRGCTNSKCQKHRIKYLLSDNHQCTVGSKLNVILDLHGTVIDDNCNRRPYADELLSFLFETCSHVSVWTAAQLEFVQPFLDYCKERGWKFHFVYHFEHLSQRLQCSDGMMYKVYTKPLRKVFKEFPTHTQHNTVIVDDNRFTYQQNYGNAVPIEEWKGSTEDTMLLKLIAYVKLLHTHHENQGTIKNLEKRNWWLMMPLDSR